MCFLTLAEKADKMAYAYTFGGLKMADKTNANIGFEKQLWDAACVLWGHIPAAEYRKVIIGLIFLR